MHCADMNFHVKADASLYLVLLEGRPSIDDCFIITLPGIRQMLEATAATCPLGQLPQN